MADGLELRKRHQKRCAKYVKGSPFSTDLDCKRCVYYAFGKLNGVKVRQSLETTDRQEAAQKLLKIQAEAKAPTQYTLADAVSRFEADRRASKHKLKTIQRYRYDLNQLITFLSGKGVVRLRKITTDDLSDWKNTWVEKATDKKQQRLRTFFRWCWKRKYIEDDPTEGLSKIMVDTGYRRERLTDAQIAKVFSAITEVHPDDPALIARATAFMQVLRYTALRIGDVTNLQKSHLSSDKLLLRTLKTGQAVYTVVPACVLESLKAIETDSAYYFFPGHEGTLETWKKKWSEILKPAYQKAGIKARSHVWRDTLVFKLLQGGVSIELIARLLGHANTKITWKYYAEWVPELQKQLEDAVRKVIHSV